MDNNEVIMDDGVTVREFGRQIGKSHVWVLKLVNSGALPRNADGTIPLEAGLKAFADYLTAPKQPVGRPKSNKSPQTEQPTRGRGRPRKNPVPDPSEQKEKRQAGRPRKYPAKEKTEKKQPEPMVEMPIEPPVPVSPPASEASKVLNRKDEAVNINSALNKAKLADKTYQARMRELEYKLRAGELVEKSEVSKEAQWLATQVKAKLMAIPPRISTLCEGRLSRDIEEIITDSLNDALKELQKCKYSGEQQQ